LSYDDSELGRVIRMVEQSSGRKIDDFGAIELRKYMKKIGIDGPHRALVMDWFLKE